MKHWETVKERISKETKSIIHTIDPAFDVDSCLNIYTNILNFKISIPIKNDLNGLEKAIIESLTEIFVESKLNNTSIGVFCKNFEQFIKKIYYILEESNVIESEHLLDQNKLQALGPYLSSLNKTRPIYLDTQGKEVTEIELAARINGKPVYKINPQTKSKMFVRLIPNRIKRLENGLVITEDFSLDDYDDVNCPDLNNKHKNTFLLYFIKAIILKNEQSHQAPEPTHLTIINNLNSTLIAELWIINFFKKELTDAIKKNNSTNKDVTEYINFEIQKLKKQNAKFVSLNLKELTNQPGGGRSGFIENLLGNGLKRIRILGQGGSGKTTTLEYLLYNDALHWSENRPNSKIPVLISLGNLSSNETIVESLAKKLHFSVEYIEELLQINSLKLYLDGVNEIVESRESKKLKLQEIGSLLQDYPNLSVVITDRYEFDSYQSNMYDVPTFQIQKLSSEQIQEFVKKYCSDSIEQSDRVLEVLNSKVNIQELLLRPLVLTRAIEIIKIENDLPDQEGQIIEKFLDILLKREKDEKMDPLLNVSNFKLLLSYSASKIWEKHSSNSPVHPFTFNKLLIEGAEIFGLEKFNAGYISRIGYELEILSKGEDTIQFFHQSYIEFFCKHYLKYQHR